MKTSRRVTARKAIIEEILARDYSGGPVLLEELRWKVLTQQYGPDFVEMSDAKMKSFTRTIREHCPMLTRQPISIESASVGIIARAALYRIKSRNTIDRFLAAERKSITLNIGFPDHFKYLHLLEAVANRYHHQKRRVTVGIYFHGYQSSLLAGQNNFDNVVLNRTILPKSHRLIVIEDAYSTRRQSLSTLADVPWQIMYSNNRIESVSKKCYLGTLGEVLSYDA